MKVWAADYILGSRTLTRGRHTFPDKFEIRARACAAVAVKVLPTAEVALPPPNRGSGPSWRPARTGART